MPAFPLIRRKHSFATRLSTYIVSMASVVFIIIFIICGIFTTRIVKNEAVNHAKSELNSVVYQLTDILHQVEIATLNMEHAVRQELDNPDKLINITEYIVSSNPYIMGSTVAFRPNYFAGKGEKFSPYSYRDAEGKVHRTDLGTDEYDYHNQPWYTEPHRQNKDTWSEPYFDEGGGNEIMSTFSHPIRDAKGEIIAILTADISLKHLADLVLAIHPYPGAYCFMLDRNGTYLVHHKRERILYQKMVEATNYMADTRVKELARAMQAGESGIISLMDKNTPCFVLYTPLSATGWPLALVCPENEVFVAMNRMMILIISLFVAGMCMLTFFCRAIIRKTSRPIKKFGDAAREVAQGNLNAALPEIKTNDELSSFHQAFSYMQQSLGDYITELKTTTSIKERMEGELHVARRIQMGMIPKLFPTFPERAELDLYAYLRPAREVGGDLYDFFVQDEKLFFVVGDVSGKGVPASLVMAITCRLVRLIAQHSSSPAEIARTLNDSLAAENDANMFVTMFIGALDLQTGKLRYCNAGHNEPVLALPGGSCEFQKVIPNLPIAIFDGFQFQEQEMQLPDHAALFIYTDGVNEAENHEKKQFGNERTLKSIRQHCYESARAIITTLTEAVDHFADAAEQSDDITMLCLRYHRTKETGTLVMPEKELSITNKLADLDKLPAFVEEIGEALVLPVSLQNRMTLALEEAMVNCVKYAYPEGTEGSISLTAHWDEENHVLTYTLKDEGTPFNPTAKPDADITQELDDRPIGGLGILLTRRIMDNVSYRHDGTSNILIMEKKIYAYSG